MSLISLGERPILDQWFGTGLNGQCVEGNDFLPLMFETREKACG